MVWSHGSVVRGAAAPPSSAPWRARQLPLETARAIAAKGGVVGLWALSIDVGRSPEAYADRLLQMVDWLGEDHVGFGTDINGLGPNAALRSYADVRRVVETCDPRGLLITTSCATEQEARDLLAMAPQWARARR